MEAFEAIRTRRSIRQFEDRPIPDEIIKDLLTAAMSAPSAGNQQPWHFVIIDDRQVLGKVPELNPYAGMARQAPLAILVCGDLSLEKFPDSGFRTAPRPRRTCSSLHMPKAWGLSGQVFSHLRTELRASAHCVVSPRRSFP